MAISSTASFKDLLTEAKRYQMTGDIAKTNLATLRFAKKGDKFITDGATGLLTLDCNTGFINSVKRTYTKSFKISSIVATFQYAIEELDPNISRSELKWHKGRKLSERELRDLEQHFNCVVGKGEGIGSLIETYKANTVFTSVYHSLVAIKGHYSKFVKSLPEPTPIARRIVEEEPVAPVPPPRVFKKFSEEEENSRLEKQRGLFGKMMTTLKHKSMGDLRTLLKKPEERQIRPPKRPLPKSRSLNHIDLLKSEEANNFLNKAKLLKEQVVEDDNSEWEDEIPKPAPKPPEKEKARFSSDGLSPELIKKLEALNKRLNKNQLFANVRFKT
jgi:hypothetical protein